MKTYQKVKMNLLRKGLLCTLLFLNIIGSLQQSPPVIPSKQPLSVIVLDTTFGGVAPNVTVKIFQNISPDNLTENFVLVATAVTNAVGKVDQLLSAVDYTLGRYRMLFGIGDYYHSHGISSFFPTIQITYENRDGSAAVIPVVISPFGINTYKGSSGATIIPITTTTTTSATTTTSSTTTTSATTTTTTAPGLLGNLLNNIVNLLG